MMIKPQLKKYRAMLADPALPSALSAPMVEAMSFVWPKIRAAQRAGDFDLAEKLAREALEGATPLMISIFEARVAEINGEMQ